MRDIHTLIQDDLPNTGSSSQAAQGIEARTAEFSKPMPPKRPDGTVRRRLFAAAFFFVLAMTGGHFVMSATLDTAPRKTTWPLRFKAHNFDAFCYNTLTCSVIYDNFNFTLLQADKPSPAPPNIPNYREKWGGASHLGIRNFSPPADVRWKSLDGVVHETTVDIAAIFKDELVRHHVPESQIPEGAFVGPAGEPDIILEVNDRTISVFTQMFIPTKAEQIPGNRNSNFREDLILAWSHTY